MGDACLRKKRIPDSLMLSVAVARKTDETTRPQKQLEVCTPRCLGASTSFPLLHSLFSQAHALLPQDIAPLSLLPVCAPQVLMPSRPHHQRMARTWPSNSAQVQKINAV